MSPATWPREVPEDERLLLIDAVDGGHAHATVGDLPAQLHAGDLLVVNDAATLPASLPAVYPSGRGGELRLMALQPDDTWWAVLMGEGNWRTPTEHRPVPDPIDVGGVITMPSGLVARVAEVSEHSARLVRVQFNRSGAALWSAIYNVGRPIQYAYVEHDLPLWRVQSHYASRPWAVELPSAGRPLTWRVLDALMARGVGVARVTHAAGISSTGDDVLDALLPLPERFDIPAGTVAAVERTQLHGGRVIAVGTSVVRALEGCVALHGRLLAGKGVTDLRLGPGTPRRVVDGLVTGLHEPTTSHFELLQAFAPRGLLEAAYAQATQRGYLIHEFGDSNLILAA